MIVLFVAASLFVATNVSAQTDSLWFLSAADSVCGVSLRGLAAPQVRISPPRNSETVVALIDGGVDIAHPDLGGLIWTNPREQADNGRDDDRNGYPDDLHGWNFLGNAAGEVFLKAGTEPFREYKRLRPRFRDVDTSLLAAGSKAEYAYYKRMERAARLDTYVTFARYLAEQAEAFCVCDSLMAARYGDRETLVADFLNLEPADTAGLGRAWTLVATPMLSMMARMPWRDLVAHAKNANEEAAARVASLDDPSDDPHLKLGNDPEDFRCFRYGNSRLDVDAHHGTMVAGVLAACIRALPDLPGAVSILPIRAIPEGDEYDRDVAAAIRYAVDNGAWVVNMSFGKYVSPHRAEVLAALKYARRHDVLLVLAAGNDGCDVDARPIFPACCDARGRRFDHLLVVGASTPDGRIASFSNYGAAHVDLLAPGVDICSTAPGGCYDRAQGTSIAAPVVSGVAAVVRSLYPDLSARQVREILMSTVRDRSTCEMPAPGFSRQPRTVTGREVCASAGILDAEAALRKAAANSKYGQR